MEDLENTQKEKGPLRIGRSLKRGKITYIARTSSGKLMARADTLDMIKTAINKFERTDNADLVAEEKSEKIEIKKEEKPKPKVTSDIKSKKTRPNRFRGYSLK